MEHAYDFLGENKITVVGRANRSRKIQEVPLSNVGLLTWDWWIIWSRKDLIRLNATTFHFLLLDNYT